MAFLKICILELKIPYLQVPRVLFEFSRGKGLRIEKERHEKAERERRRDEREAEYCRRVSRKGEFKRKESRMCK